MSSLTFLYSLSDVEKRRILLANEIFDLEDDYLNLVRLFLQTGKLDQISTILAMNKIFYEVYFLKNKHNILEEEYGLYLEGVEFNNLDLTLVMLSIMEESQDEHIWLLLGQSLSYDAIKILIQSPYITQKRLNLLLRTTDEATMSKMEPLVIEMGLELPPLLSIPSEIWSKIAGYFPLSDRNVIKLLNTDLSQINLEVSYEELIKIINNRDSFNKYKKYVSKDNIYSLGKHSMDVWNLPAFNTLTMLITDELFDYDFRAKEEMKKKFATLARNVYQENFLKRRTVGSPICSQIQTLKIFRSYAWYIMSE